MTLSTYNGFTGRQREESFAWQKAEAAAGRLGPPSRCEACGESRGHLDYHTEDYSKPFGPHIYQYQLCLLCHLTLHSRFKQPNVWARYIEQLEAGAVYEPLMSRKEIGRVWIKGWVERPVGHAGQRARQEFFRSLSMERRESPVHHRVVPLPLLRMADRQP